MIVKPEKSGRDAATAGLASVVTAAQAAAGTARRGPPPVHLWNPPFCGDIDMRIARDGTWHYQGSPIGREALVRLFAGILKREGDRFYLVTPVEKVGITVEDAPFVAVDVDRQIGADGPRLTFTTNMGDAVVAGPDHPIRLSGDPGAEDPATYVHVRAGLEARLDRKTFYRLVEMGEHRDVDGRGWFGLVSSGRFFAMIPSEDLR